jgi:hypothetical protein
MNKPELDATVKGFEVVIKAGEELREKGTRLAAILGTFFAMWCALKIRAHLRICGGDEIEDATDGALIESQSEDCGTLPKFDAVHNAAERLIAAATLQNRAGITSALAEMGVLALCPRPSQQFTRMELVARSVTGRAQLIPLVELSLFAIELGEFEKAGKYAIEARSSIRAHMSCTIFAS